MLIVHRTTKDLENHIRLSLLLDFVILLKHCPMALTLYVNELFLPVEIHFTNSTYLQIQFILVVISDLYF